MKCLKTLMALTTLLFIIITFNTSAQFRDDKILYITVQNDKDTLLAGSQMAFSVKIHLKDGWHINSAKPIDEFSVPTTLNINSSVNVDTANIVYPEAITIKNAMDDTLIPVYSNLSEIKGFLKIPAEAEAGKVKVNFELQYQACNNQTCLAPDKEVIEKEFVIIKSRIK